MKATSKASTIILSLCEAVIGVLLLVNPVGFTTGIITFLGAILLLMGIAGVVRYFRTAPEQAVLERKLTWGLLGILLGLFCITQSGWFIAAFPILTILYGIGTLVTGISKVQLTVDMIRMKARRWGWAAASAALTVICALVILANPFSTTAVLWAFVAVTLIVEAVVDIVVAIFARPSDAMDW